MRDLQSYVDEEFRKTPEEAMRLYDGKTREAALPHLLKSQLASRLNKLEAGDCRRRRKTPSFRRSHLAKPKVRRQTIRRELLKRCNVLFFERKEASEKPSTKDLWIYDLRTNQHFCLPSSGSAESPRRSSFTIAANAAGQSLKTNPLANKDLDDFKACYGEKTAGCKPALHTRQETERFKKFTYAEMRTRRRPSAATCQFTAPWRGSYDQKKRAAL